MLKQKKILNINKHVLIVETPSRIWAKTEVIPCTCGERMALMRFYVVMVFAFTPIVILTQFYLLFYP